VLPDAFVQALNHLGFVLLDSSDPYRLYRQAVGNEIELTVDRMAPDRWRVEVRWRPGADLLSRQPYPWTTMRLGRLGHSTDDLSLELSTDELVKRLPDFLDTSVLPRIDAAPV
jgi:hypothetical protein